MIEVIKTVITIIPAFLGTLTGKKSSGEVCICDCPEHYQLLFWVLFALVILYFCGKLIFKLVKWLLKTRGGKNVT